MKSMNFSSAYYQRGASPFVTLLFVSMLAFFVTIGFKLAPAYYDFWNIQEVAESFKNDANLAQVDVGEIESRIDKRLMTNNIRDLNRKEAIKVAIQEQVLYIDVEYEKRVKMFANVDAVMSFKHNVEIPFR